MLHVFSAIALAIAGIIGYRKARRRVKTLAQLADVLPGHARMRRFCPVFNGACDGAAFEIRIESGGGDKLARLIFSVEVPARHELRVCARSRWNVFSAAFGSLKQAKTGDADFDARFLVLADEPASAVLFFADSERKKRYADLLDWGWRYIKVSGGRAQAEKALWLEDDLSPANLQYIIKTLAALCRDA